MIIGENLHLAPILIRSYIKKFLQGILVAPGVENPPPMQDVGSVPGVGPTGRHCVVPGAFSSGDLLLFIQFFVNGPIQIVCFFL